MCNRGDARRRLRPVVSVLALLVLVVVGILTCPALVDSATAADTAAQSVIMVAAHDHAEQGGNSPHCGPDSVLSSESHARPADRSAPISSFEALTVQDTGRLAWSVPTRPSPRWHAPDPDPRSGRVLLTDLVIAQI